MKLHKIKIFLIDLLISIIISIMLIIISRYSILALIITLIVLKIFYPQIKGAIGELKVRIELNDLPKEQYKILNNLMVKFNETTYQIDHLIISKFGIFVIETKNYYGYIFGDIYQKQWIQKTSRKRNKKFYFKNPIQQNYGHIKALENLLNIPESNFIPIVCFSNKARLSEKLKNKVIQLNDLINIILNSQETIIEMDLDIIYNKIKKLNISDKIIRKRHVKTIKTKIKEENKKIANMICPKCGGQLLSKEGKYGIFLGCSNYPICKFNNKTNK